MSRQERTQVSDIMWNEDPNILLKGPPLFLNPKEVSKTAYIEGTPNDFVLPWLVDGLVIAIQEVRNNIMLGTS